MERAWERVEFLCSHETLAQCCDSSFSVRAAQLAVSVLISTMTSYAGLESYQSQTLCHNNVRSTRVTLVSLLQPPNHPTHAHKHHHHPAQHLPLPLPPPPPTSTHHPRKNLGSGGERAHRLLATHKVVTAIKVKGHPTKTDAHIIMRHHGRRPCAQKSAREPHLLLDVWSLFFGNRHQLLCTACPLVPGGRSAQLRQIRSRMLPRINLTLSKSKYTCTRNWQHGLVASCRIAQLEVMLKLVETVVIDEEISRFLAYLEPHHLEVTSSTWR